MTLEELLVSRITGDATMAALLANYNNKPAVFEREAPSDMDQGWGSEQYPRIDYLVDRSEDSQRQIQGTLAIDVWALLTSANTPESVETRLRALLDGGVFHPDNEPVIALRWRDSNPFQAGDPKDKLNIGYTVAFDLLAFPSQTTTEPDPVAALQTWATAKMPGMTVDPASWAPTDAEPALYFRLETWRPVQQLAGVTWIEAIIMAHIIAPTAMGRLPWIRAITDRVLQDKWTPMADGAPLFFYGLGADSTADHLRRGQVRLTVRYGLLPPPDTSVPIATINYSGVWGEKGTVQ